MREYAGMNGTLKKATETKRLPLPFLFIMKKLCAKNLFSVSWL
jgi:hypothetical protein